MVKIWRPDKEASKELGISKQRLNKKLDSAKYISKSSKGARYALMDYDDITKSVNLVAATPTSLIDYGQFEKDYGDFRYEQVEDAWTKTEGRDKKIITFFLMGYNEDEIGGIFQQDQSTISRQLAGLREKYKL